MSKIVLIIWYALVVLSPFLASVIGSFTIHKYGWEQLQPLIAAGISGSIVLWVVILKRCYDSKVILNAIKADLQCFSKYLSRSLPTDDQGRDGIVNITPFGNTKVFNSFLNQIGLLEPNLAKKVIETYDTISIIIPASCLIEGVDKINEDQLFVRADASESFRAGIRDLKTRIDTLISEM